MHKIDGLTVIGRRIRRLREMRGMSLLELSKRSSVNILDIAYLEARGADIDVVRLGRVIKVLGSSAEDVLGF